MAQDKIYYRLYQKPTPEMKRIHILYIIEEANRNFTKASKKRENITIKSKEQLKLKKFKIKK